MTEASEGKPLYYAVISGSAEHAGMPASIVAVFDETAKAVTGPAIVIERDYNNNLTRVTKPDANPIWGRRTATGLVRASKSNILARFDDRDKAEAAMEAAYKNARTSIDEFGDIAGIKTLNEEIGALEKRVRELRVELQEKRRVSWEDRFQKTLAILTEGGATEVWKDPEAST
ncbi:hypothetical protein CcrC1_gp309 [Caulobacter phage C1]|nr:hypothetical protein CcrC1_gp309 [Caulobacter phage C1]UTU08538.1 hypothetical protein CcrC2_gp310 [Caulobacter phage C2]UTU09054.1 hypothetical protein CcrJ4_gp305 [Caulobacter phage J4]UTU09613.1 hypothetical protein CcrBL47_gp327 [Caulobacter phage BL47]UTU10171.1 hypothetical protein CcrRB23_gp309 [Caulobacter phage RB23]WGN97205.1 hypothetical protein [Bertelyvirus sp.]